LSTALVKSKKDEDHEFPIELISGNDEDARETVERKSRFIEKSTDKKKK